MRYHEVQRFRMELKLLAEKYRAIGLTFAELGVAADEELKRLHDGGEERDAADEHERAKEYEEHFNRGDEDAPPIT